MDIISYSERKQTLEMMFRAKTDVTNARKNDVSTLRYARSFERLQLRTSVFNIRCIRRHVTSSISAHVTTTPETLYFKMVYAILVGFFFQCKCFENQASPLNHGRKRIYHAFKVWTDKSVHRVIV